MNFWSSYVNLFCMTYLSVVELKKWFFWEQASSVTFQDFNSTIQRLNFSNCIATLILDYTSGSEWMWISQRSFNGGICESWALVVQSDNSEALVS